MTLIDPKVQSSASHLEKFVMVEDIQPLRALAWMRDPRPHAALPKPPCDKPSRRRNSADPSPTARSPTMSAARNSATTVMGRRRNVLRGRLSDRNS